jgi:hypothetical protein
MWPEATEHTRLTGELSHETGVKRLAHETGKRAQEAGIRERQE